MFFPQPLVSRAFQYIFHTVKDSQASRFGSPVDTSLNNAFSCNDSLVVYISHAVESMVGVFHFVHVPSGSTNVWSWHIYSWANEIVFGQLDSISPDKSFLLRLGVICRIDFNTSFSTSIGYFYHC